MIVRIAKPEDWSAIKAHHEAQNTRDGTDYPLPPFFAPNGEWAANILFALVVERDGAVVGATYFEKCAEMCFAGIDPQATAILQRESERIGYALKGRGITSWHCFVPAALAGTVEAPGPVARPLGRAGFERDTEFAHFFRDLRGI